MERSELPPVFPLAIRATAIYMPRDLTVNKRSLGNSRPSFLLAIIMHLLFLGRSSNGEDHESDGFVRR